MFWEVSVFKAGVLISRCTLNATGSLEAINRIEAEVKSWPIILAGENEPQAYTYRAYEFQARLIP